MPHEEKKLVTNLGWVRTKTSRMSGQNSVFANVHFLARYSVCVRTVPVWLGQVKEEVFPVRMTFHLFSKHRDASYTLPFRNRLVVIYI